ncbi:DUF4309 domain-containing protein [Sporosarcina sp. BP05]|uniref:DUF4309 domain-containing protein n=1 Tax=Sporosarcina sp. BP05 TaxID=2758726 RepID=UPI0016485642
MTVDDLLKQVGKPIEKRTIAKNGEVNYIYQFKPYELQFIFGKDNALKHVNLLKGK